MNNSASIKILKKKYALDVENSETPWAYWELNLNNGVWNTFKMAPRFTGPANAYRRKADAPDWEAINAAQNPPTPNGLVDIQQAQSKAILPTKKYRCRNGKEIKIYAFYPSEIHGAINEHDSDLTWLPVRWDTFGKIMYSAGVDESDDGLDLVEINMYDHIKLDEGVYVRNRLRRFWFKRHFAGVNEYGNPTVWDQGQTSWSGAKRIVWEQLLTVDEYNTKFGAEG